MKRLFITTDVTKAKNLYEGIDDNLKNHIESEFEELRTGKEFTYGDHQKIIILNDGFKTWADDYIITENDYILYHETSTEDVKKSIANIFRKTHIAFGSHFSDRFHDKVFRILFDDKNDKFNRIFTALNFTAIEIERKNKLEALIYLTKYLQLLPLKGNWSEDIFRKTKQALENSEKISTVKDKLVSIQYKENKSEFLKQLEVLINELIKLSSAN